MMADSMKNMLYNQIDLASCYTMLWERCSA